MNTAGEKRMCEDSTGTGQKPAAGSGLGQTRPVLLCDKEKWQQMRKNNATKHEQQTELPAGERKAGGDGGCRVALQWQKI